MYLSIVIPAYNEGKKIAQDIIAASRFLKTNFFSGEIIIVDDGSRDNTFAVVKKIKIASEIPIHVIRYQAHRGKGYAIRTGILTSKGEFVLFIDSGHCVPYDNILRGLHILRDGICDVAHASRFLPESKILKPHTLSRRISSRLFRKFLIFFLNIPSELTDTQCGLKIYRGEVARTLYRQCRTDGFIFDIEIILRALKQGFRIKEFPIEWTADHDSRLSLMRIPLRLLIELIRLKRILAKEVQIT